MMLKHGLIAVLALGSAYAAPREKRQDSLETTINVQLVQSTLLVIKEVDNIPLDDVPVSLDQPYTANIVDAECNGGWKIAFHCTLFGPNNTAGIEVGSGTTQFIYDAFATIEAVSCAPGALGSEV